jgi:hypothetical protein
MGILQTPIERIVSELARLQKARGELEAGVIEDRAKLTELRSTLGDVELAALLEGGDSGKVRSEIYSLDVRIEGRNAARPKLLERIREALRALGHERAEVKRAEAQKLRIKLGEHLAAVAKLQKSLEDAAGTLYIPALHAPLVAGALYVENDLPRLPLSIAQNMEAEIHRRRAEADRIEKTAIQSSQGGHVSGTLADLLAVSANVELIGPTKGAIEAWAVEATARADAEWANVLLDYSNPTEVKPVPELAYNLAWDATGAIDPKQSQAMNRQAVPDNRPVAVPKVESRILGPRAA